MEVTIKHIAEKAGVSYATVSRALSGKTNVSDTTARRILEIAKAMNYRPNVIARNLVKRDSQTIGLVIPDISNPYFAEMALAITQCAEEQGYQTFLCNTRWQSHSEKKQLNLLRENRVSGVLLGSVQNSNPQEYAQLQLPLVLFGGSGEAGLDCVDTDNRMGGRLAAQHLLEMGYTRPAFLGGRSDSLSDRDRLAHYRRTLEENGVPLREEYVLSGEFTMEGGYRMMRRLLELAVPPNGVFCGNDLMALGALQCASEMGVDVPAQCGIVGFDDIAYAALPQIRLTTISQPKWEIGRRAVEILLERISSEEAPDACTEQIAPSLVVRATTARVGA